MATEAQLLAQNRSIADLRAANSRLEHNNTASQRLLDDARRKEAATKEAQREIRLALRQALEERNMSDHVVHEYADLVKSLEAKSISGPRAILSPEPVSETSATEPKPTISLDEDSHPPASHSTPLNAMIEGRNGLQKLVEDMSAETSRLHEQLQILHVQLETAKTEVTALQAVGAEDRQRLSATQSEILRHEADDTAAAKLVSRYMYVMQCTL